MELADAQGNMQTSESIMKENIETVCQLLFEDSYFTLEKLAYRLLGDCSRMPTSQIIQDELQLQSFHIVGPPTLDRRLQEETLSYCDLFWRTVRRGRRWLICMHRYWRWNMAAPFYTWIQTTEYALVAHLGEHRTKKQVTFSVRKVMGTVFWDQKNILLCEYITKGTMINSVTYQNTHKVESLFGTKDQVWQKQCFCFMMMCIPILWMPSKTCSVKFKWHIFQHPPYLPNLVPGDYHFCFQIWNVI